MDGNLKIIFWNVRGLNSRAKRSAVRSVISSAAPCVVCLQETKLAHMSDSLVLETLGAPFLDFYFLPADGTRGGILLAWRCDMISLSRPTIGDHHVSALVSPLVGDQHWWLTGVYGPQRDEEKIAFLGELHEFRDTCAGPWLIEGDFNMITSAADKNNSRLNHRTMSRFRRFIADHELRPMSRITQPSSTMIVCSAAQPGMLHNPNAFCAVSPRWRLITPLSSWTARHTTTRPSASTLSGFGRSSTATWTWLLMPGTPPRCTPTPSGASTLASRAPLGACGAGAQNPWEAFLCSSRSPASLLLASTRHRTGARSRRRRHGYGVA
ncbi:hypothetical protein VPH35_130159 [Triticum aestivum]